MPKMALRGATIAAALASALPYAPAAADTTAEFYARTPISFYVGAGVAGGFDLYSRVLMEHMPRHIPGRPNVVVRNMPGAGGAKAANYMYNAAAKDGSVMGMPISAVVISEAMYPDKVKFRSRDFGWIGTISTMTDVLGVRADLGVKTIDDAKSKVVVIGSTTPQSQTYLQPGLVNALLGTKFRIVNGYASANDITIAQERGEVEGRTNPWDSWITQRPDWIRDGKLAFIVQFGPKLPELPGVPTFLELVSTPKDRALVELLELMQYMGRSVALPPGVPAERLAALRKAFDSTIRDPAFIADVKARKLTLNSRTGAEFQADLDRIMPSAQETARTLKTALKIE